MDYSIGIEIRKDVLIKALYIEAFVNYFLGGLLGVKNIKNSISFGHTGKALSFYQKVNLLIDVGALKKQDQNKFITFMEIRNQFMHNFEAKTFELCLSFIEGKDKFLLHTYPQNSSFPREIQLKSAVEDLTFDVMKLSIGILDKIKEKISKESLADIYKIQFEKLLKSIDETQEVFDDLAEKIQLDENFDTKKLKGLGQVMANVIIQKSKKAK